MPKYHRIIFNLYAAFISALFLYAGRIPVSYAADDSGNSSSSKIIGAIVIIVLFTAAFIISAILTYKLKKKSFNSIKSEAPPEQKGDLN